MLHELGHTGHINELASPSPNGKEVIRLRKQSFIAGTMILLAAGVVNRILGFVPRIALPRIVGPEGVGLYQMGYPFMILVLTLLTSGVPLAVAKLVAEASSERNEHKVRSILVNALSLTVSLGFLFAAISYLAAPWIASHLFTDARVYQTFICMTPIIPIAAVSAVLRGYFQGLHNMIPTASSQVAETLCRIAGMLLFAWLLLPYGVEWAAAGAMIGVVLGEVCGMAVLLFHLNQHRTAAGMKTEYRRTSNFRRLFSISVPVTASRLVGSASYMLEAVFITQSLAAAGIATAVATAQYGALQGMVIPILLLPGALTTSLSVSLVPSLSEAAARGDMKTIHKRLYQSIRLALVTGAPFAVLMFVLAEPICYYLYGNAEVGKMLKMMAPAAVFLYFQGPLQATLQALDRPGNALINTFFGSVVKLTLIVLLASRPQWGIYGAVFASNINIILVTLLHWHTVSRMLKFSIKTADYWKTGMAAALMACCCHMVMEGDWIGMPFIRFLSACAAGGVLYLLCIVWLKLVDRDDLSRIPWIRKK
jgi:stage V sporulation protein B